LPVSNVAMTVVMIVGGRIDADAVEKALQRRARSARSPSRELRTAASPVVRLSRRHRRGAGLALRRRR
jgi:hypothetical protein